MNTTSRRKNLKIAVAVAGLALFIGGGLWYDSRGGDSSPAVASAAGKSSPKGTVAKSRTVDVDPCSFLTTEDIEAATGLKNMKGHDEGTSSGTGARVCQYDQGTGMLPTLTIYARPTEFEDWNGDKTSYVEHAQQTYKGVDLPGVGDAAFITSKSVYIQKGEVTIEISTLVMKGYLPGSIEGEPLKELARRAAGTAAS